MSTVITAAGCIPLMSHGPSPSGVNSAQNFRQGLIGALVTAAPTTPSAGPPAWLSGVLCTTSYNNFAGNYPVDLMVISQNTPGQSVLVYAGVSVVSRGPTNGPYLACFNTTSTINLDAADATNPRIDVVYVQVNDDAIGDAGSTNGATMAVVNGTPASSPTAPAIPAGAIPLAQIYRNTVANSGNAISQSNLTDVRTSAGTAGGIRTYLPGDSLTAAGSHSGEFTFDIANYGLRYWLANAWHGTVLKTYSGTWANGTTDITVGTNSAAPTVIMTANIPDPGYPYKLDVSGAADTSGWGTFTPGSPPWTLVTTRVGSSTGTLISQARLYPQQANGLASTGIALAANITGTLTGAQTVYFVGYASVAYNVLYATVAAMSTYLTVDVIPV